MQRPLAFAFAFTFAACSAGPERAAAPPSGQAASPPVGARDPQASYEPRSAPGAGQQWLARLAGDFDVQKTFHPRDGGAPAISNGTCRQTMVHGGRFLQAEFTFAAADGNATGTTTGTGVIGFDAATGKFTSFWYDSRSTRFSVRQSEGALADDELVLWNRAVGEDGNGRRSRTATHIDADGQHVQHRQWSVAADGSERLVMELLLTRRGG
jgi:hypothetical protein